MVRNKTSWKVFIDEMFGSFLQGELPVLQSGGRPMEELCPSQLVDEPPLSQGEQGQARVGTPLGLG